MSGGTIAKNSGIKKGRWFSYNQKVGGRAIPELPGTDNLQSLHIIEPSGEKAI